MFNLVSIFDTTIGSYNLGNNIIMDSVNLELSELFSESQFYKLPPMDIRRYTRNCIAKSDLTFFGGTNSLNANMRKYKQWDLRFRNVFSVRDVILMGLGWWQYENKPITPYTRYLLKETLSTKYIHSVRDNYTKEKLNTIGIKSINTGCPTLWRLNQQILNSIPKIKQESVVFTITDYNKDPYRDKIMINACQNNYKNVFCFPQGTGDIEYVKELGYKSNIEFLKPRIMDFNIILESNTVDYIGTRLHAGIRALQKSVHSIIIGIDNRAIEMGKNFGLLLINYEDIKELDELIKRREPIYLNIPFKEIDTWKAQFK